MTPSSCHGVVEDAGELRQVARTQQVGDVPHGLLGEEGQGLGLDLEEGAPCGLDGGDPLGAHEAVLGVVGAEGKEVLVLEIAHVATLRRPAAATESGAAALSWGRRG